MGRCSESFFKQLCQQVHFNPALQYPCLPSKCQFLPGAECPQLSLMTTAEELHMVSSVLGRIRIRDSNSGAELEINPKMNFCQIQTFVLRTNRSALRNLSLVVQSVLRSRCSRGQLTALNSYDICYYMDTSMM